VSIQAEGEAERLLRAFVEPVVTGFFDLFRWHRWRYVHLVLWTVAAVAIVATVFPVVLRVSPDRPPSVVTWDDREYHRGEPDFEWAVGQLAQRQAQVLRVGLAALLVYLGIWLCLAPVAFWRGHMLRREKAHCVEGDEGRRFEFAVEEWEALCELIAQAEMLPERDPYGHSYRVREHYRLAPRQTRRLAESLSLFPGPLPPDLSPERLGAFITFLRETEGRLVIW
jgi:hypothetical protein